MDGSHYFLFEPLQDKSGLEQGDILLPDDGLNKLLKEVHPHFHDDRYSAFLVLTQTCDLVIRDPKPCKSPYVNLAVVRPINTVLEDLLPRVCSPAKLGEQILGGIYDSRSKPKAREFLVRVLNQNEHALGLFFITADASIGISESSVALLQVSFAVRSQDHYSLLVNARSGRLRRQYQSKLGWMAGYLYSRVATEDMPEERMKQLLDELLADDIRWLPKERLEAAYRDGLTLDGMDVNEAYKIISRKKARTKRDVVIDRMMDAVDEVLGPLDEQDRSQIETRLRSDDRFKEACPK